MALRAEPRRDDSSRPTPIGYMTGVGALTAVGVLSGLVNLLYLTGSLFMLEVYDRVLPSRSLPTLAGLGVLVLGLYVFQGFFDIIRGRLLVRIAVALDGMLRRKTYEAVVRAPLAGCVQGDGLQPLRDLDQVRSFLSSSGPAVLFDLPWVPLYIGLCFAFHFWIGVTSLAGAVLLIVLTITTDFLTRTPTRSAAQAAGQSTALANASQQNAEVLRAMGMVRDMADAWEEACDGYVRGQRRIADITGGLSALTRVVRLALQSGVLAVGAYLVILGEATGGIMIASSILLSRALAPVELAIGNWKGFAAARQSWARLRSFLARFPDNTASITLPTPHINIDVEKISVVAPGCNRLLVQDLSFSVSGGEVLAVVGPSGSGKSSLARALVGVWRPIGGSVKLDGASLEQWEPDRLGRHIGYLPQDVDLFQGTIAQNIARFSTSTNSDLVIDAARAAGVHELICSMPNGYDTQIRGGGTSLSAGQRQRIALARALYRQPFLVVLDEPNSNLDADGEAALLDAIRNVRERGAAVVVMAHRQSVLTVVDRMLVLANGRMRGLGTRDDVMRALQFTGPSLGSSARAQKRELLASNRSSREPPRITAASERPHRERG